MTEGGGGSGGAVKQQGRLHQLCCDNKINIHCAKSVARRDAAVQMYDLPRLPQMDGRIGTRQMTHALAPSLEPIVVITPASVASNGGHPYSPHAFERVNNL